MNSAVRFRLHTVGCVVCGYPGGVVVLREHRRWVLHASPVISRCDLGPPGPTYPGSRAPQPHPHRRTGALDMVTDRIPASRQ